YTRLVYQPMLELRRYLRRNGYRTYIVTGGGQDFARAYAREYGIPAEKIIGSALETLYEYNCNEQGILMREPKLRFEDNFSGKPEDIYLFIGRHPKAAFGNSTGTGKCLSKLRRRSDSGDACAPRRRRPRIRLRTSAGTA